MTNLIMTHYEDFNFDDRQPEDGPYGELEFHCGGEPGVLTGNAALVNCKKCNALIAARDSGDTIIALTACGLLVPETDITFFGKDRKTVICPVHHVTSDLWTTLGKLLEPRNVKVSGTLEEATEDAWSNNANNARRRKLLENSLMAAVGQYVNENEGFFTVADHNLLGDFTDFLRDYDEEDTLLHDLAAILRENINATVNRLMAAQGGMVVENITIESVNDCITRMRVEQNVGGPRFFDVTLEEKETF